MSKPSPEDRQERESTAREAAGYLVVGLADELARPLGEIRELLATVVGELDEHVADARGPDPLSYDQSREIRESIAEAYLKAANVARLAQDLADAVRGPGAVESADFNALIEAALGLVRHRFSASTELFIDLGSLPPVSTPAGELVMALARLLVFCAESSAASGEAAVSIRTRASGEGGRPEVLALIAENGRGGSEDEIERATAMLQRIADRLGGQLYRTSEPGSGSTFELRLPVAG